jgi:hypothetical protein
VWLKIKEILFGLEIWLFYVGELRQTCQIEIQINCTKQPQGEKIDCRVVENNHDKETKIG